MKHISLIIGVKYTNDFIFFEEKKGLLPSCLLKVKVKF